MAAAAAGAGHGSCRFAAVTFVIVAELGRDLVGARVGPALALGPAMPRSARLLFVSLLFSAACAPSEAERAFEETGVTGPFAALRSSSNSVIGPVVRPGASTEVWAATNAWSDTHTADARLAGIAWPADSGLSWDEKFQRWIDSFELTDRSHGSGETFVVATPFGERSFPAPTLECAEVALFLRATFASWYHLPFFVSGYDANARATMYAGHFGFVMADGSRAGRFPNFRDAYLDHEGSWEPGAAWPSDPRLADMHLGDDDDIAFADERLAGEGAGAYFDALFLNKRAGYFMRLLLLYFGSTNLADDANMVHITPESAAAGDIMLHRWKRRGVGHVMPIMKVVRHAEDAFEISIASGSMPRREPLWERPEIARRRFVSNWGGGEGQTSDGHAYAALGGGLRRWRTASAFNGRWRNVVRDPRIRLIDEEAIAARPARFDEILRTLTPEDYRDAALSEIAQAREHLRTYPASCAARRNRENAFESLYEAMAELGWTPAEVDAHYRELEDFVFRELDYDASRTCCWNRSNAAMATVILDYAEAEQAAATANGECVEPTVFRAEEDGQGGYARWSAHAATLGLDWRAWSEDESCPQRDVLEDSLGERGAYACAAEEAPAVGPCGVEQGSALSAVPLAAELQGEVCTAEEDWYRVEGPAFVTLSFSHAAGDLDLIAVDAAGEEIARSISIDDEESVEVPAGTHYVAVYGYGGAANAYAISVGRE